MSNAFPAGDETRSSKVPEIVLGFWIVKILATTLGEIGGDAVTMSMNLGYLVGTMIFAVVFVLFVRVQIGLPRFNPWLYWGTIVASTTVGTTLADFADRSLGIGYTGGTTLLLSLLLGSLFAWHRTTGDISVTSVRDRRSEWFYWITITFSQTLGTALGDWVADTHGMGYTGGMLVFGGLLAVVLVLYVATRANRTTLFWVAFVLTRPLGAVVGDFLDKPLAKGGLDLSRYTGSLVLLAAIVLLVALLPQRPARVAH
ncbi:MAG: hypothetical protein JSR34_06790 [Proteobacteria bacterium]|nr:hypothetical protein [Pseudomonadota bacterium]